MPKDKSKENDDIKEKIREKLNEDDASDEFETEEIDSGGSQEKSNEPALKEKFLDKRKSKTPLFDQYAFENEGVPVEIRITKRSDFVPVYELTTPIVSSVTKKMLEGKLRGELVSDVKLDISEILDPKKFEEVKSKFMAAAKRIIERNFSGESDRSKHILSVYLIQNTLGLGNLDNLLADERLEEVVINNSRETVWVYHKKFGWCKTNISLESEEQIYDYASLIARKIGRQINVLNPMLDAHLPSGDRVNSTLFPISNFGNTLTIRKFSRNPWTLTNLIKSKTLSVEVGALIWLCIQNELSLLVTGGTGSGKTSFLNAMAALIPSNHRIISIEDTRELTLPKFLHWVPMVVREANPEGRGEVTMLDLMVNALRQRPDRIIVGEIRRQREAEILFEAMHTGHSVYATLHADNTEQTISRLINPPINTPPQMLDAVSGIVVTFRHRRFNIRRVIEFSEVLKKGDFNVIHRWDVATDRIKQVAKLSRLSELLSLYAGMNDKEITDDLLEKCNVLSWMVRKGYEDVDQVGRIVSHYYLDPDTIIEAVKKDSAWTFSTI